MGTRQLVCLFLCSLVTWTTGNGLIPLLPGHGRQLGASTEMIGYYFAIMFLAIALGAVGSGWLSDRLQRRKLLLIAAGGLMALAVWLMSTATGIWQLVAFTSIVWFGGGVALAQVSILAGLFAGQNERGRIFGLLALTGGRTLAR